MLDELKEDGCNLILKEDPVKSVFFDEEIDALQKDSEEESQIFLFLSFEQDVADGVGVGGKGERKT